MSWCFVAVFLIGIGFTCKKNFRRTFQRLLGRKPRRFCDQLTLSIIQVLAHFPGISQNLPENVSIFFAKMIDLSPLTHFFKLAPFRSPLTDLIDFGMTGKVLTSATRRCSPFLDSVSPIWIKQKQNSLIGCWAPTACNLWPISAVVSTTNGRPQRSQTPFRSAFLDHFSLL